jgi:Cu-Zn family superoxide dismutase
MRSILPSLLFASAALVGCKHAAAPAPVTTPTTPAADAGSAAATPVEAVKPAPPPAKHATATMAATAKFAGVKGAVTFKEVDGGLEVTAALEGLKPGDHGFHVHEKGDCTAPDAASAGGHFNPSGHKHGGPDAAEHHEGDLGNLTAGPDGKATKTFTMKGISLGDGADSVVGKGFIIHEKADDGTTQPTGNAGARAACGVITIDPS